MKIIYKYNYLWFNALSYYRVGPLKYTKEGDLYKYNFEFTTKTGSVYVITPLSDILLFNPPAIKILGVNECHNDIATFTGDLGKVE